MNGETRMMLEQFLETVKCSQEYTQYQVLLTKIKEHPDIYQRIGEFRRRSIYFQMTDHANPIEENNQLQKEFADLQSNGLANEFMAAEHQYCTMVKSIQEYFLSQLDLELEFMKE